MTLLLCVGSALVAAASVALLMAALSGCHGDDEFLRAAQRQFDVGERHSPHHDEQWWKDKKGQMLVEAEAACTWLEGQPALQEDEYQEQNTLERQYLSESGILTTFSGNRKVSGNLVELAWTYRCIETRNSRTSLPWGAVDSED